MSASSLAKKIAEGEVTSHLVVSTFIQRIKEVNPIINAMVDARFSEALTEAEAESSVLSLWLFQSQPRDRERQAVIIRLTDMRLQSGW